MDKDVDFLKNDKGTRTFIFIYNNSRQDKGAGQWPHCAKRAHPATFFRKQTRLSLFWCLPTTHGRTARNERIQPKLIRNRQDSRRFGASQSPTYAKRETTTSGHTHSKQATLSWFECLPATHPHSIGYLVNKLSRINYNIVYA